jgi:Tfp pilus assembly protein PilO
MNSDINQRKLALLGWLFHVGGLTSLIVSGCIYHFVVSGLITHQHRQHTEEAARLETLLETAGDLRHDHVRLRNELNELEQRAEMIRQRIPDQPREAAFLQQVAEAAKERGLTIRDYQRGGVTVTETHSELEIRLTGEGDYASICGFFEDIALLPRVATVRRMTVSAPRGKEVYPLDMTLTLFFGARALETGETRG